MNYEDALRKAHAEGWKDPVAITNLEIAAYQAGMTTERKRVLAIFSDVVKSAPMRAYDIWHYINKIKNTDV